MGTRLEGKRAIITGASRGIGLAMAHQIVEQLEGVITLIERDDRTRSTRPGAILRVCVPIPAEDAMDMEIG